MQGVAEEQIKQYFAYIVREYRKPQHSNSLFYFVFIKVRK